MGGGLGLFILLISLVALSVLVYLKVSPLIVGPVVAAMLALLSGMPVLESLLQDYMQSAGNYFINFFLIFMTGAIFGKVMQETGAARVIANKLIEYLGAEKAILAAVLSAAVLTYGGVSLFVVVFAVYPLTLVLFKEANIPKRVIPATVALGAFTFTMTTPGTPQIQNIIPMQYLGTPATSAFIPGWAGGIAILVLGVFYLNYITRKYKAQGEFFDAHDEIEEVDGSEKLPSFGASIIPPILIILALNVVEPITGIEVDVVVAMLIGIIAAVALLWQYQENWRKWVEVLNVGSTNSAVVILNTCAVVGYGGVVQAAPFFGEIVEGLHVLAINDYFFPALSTTALAGISGSASGGMGIAYEALITEFQALDVPMEAIHRISSMSSGALDTLPHNGAVISVLMVCGLTHKESYKDIFVVSLLIPLLTVAAIVIPLSMLLM